MNILKVGKLLTNTYLGNVVEKLRIAEIYAKENSEYESNVNILKEIQPVKIPASDIEVKLGATWIPEEYITQFIKEKFKLEGKDIETTYQRTLGKWLLDSHSYCSNIEVNNIYGTPRINALELT